MEITVAGTIVVLELVAAGFALHIGVDHALRRSRDRTLQLCLMMFSLGSAAYLLSNPFVNLAAPTGQQLALGARLFALVVIWVAGVETVSRLTQTEPPRGFRPLLYTVLGARIVVFLSGALVEEYVAGVGPQFTDVLPWVSVPQLVLAVWWIGTVVHGSEHGRLARRALGVLAFGIVLAATALVVVELRDALLSFAVVPALLWSVTAARTNEQRAIAAAERAERTAARLTGELAGAQDDLARAAAASRALMDAASHELRTPLAVILGGVELLERTDLPPAARKSGVELVMRNARRLNELVEYLLAAKGSSDPARQPRPSLTSLTGPVRSALSLHEDLAVLVDCPEDLRAWVDPLDLTLIVTALVSNAGRHGGPHVRIQVEPDGDDVLLRVGDDGPGIDPTFQDRLFLPFEQPTTGLGRTETGGLGLGLSVARDRARANAGDLVHRREDGWTCFELRVPRTHEAWAGRHRLAT